MFRLFAIDGDGRRLELLLVLAAVSGVLLACAMLWRWMRSANARRNDVVSSSPPVPPVPAPPSEPATSTHEDQAKSAKTFNLRRFGIATSRTRPSTLLDHARHGETDHLLPARATTQHPLYSVKARQPHAGRAEHGSSSRNLPLNDTHDEPLQIAHHHAHSKRTHDSTHHASGSTATGNMSVHSHRVHEGSKHAPIHNLTTSATLEDFRQRLQANFAEFPKEGPDADELDVPEGPGKRYREMARSEARLRKVAFENSKRAFRLGRKAEARQLSEEGKLHDKRFSQYNALAAAEIFECNNPRYYNGPSSSLQQLSKCDLHGLHVEEAVKYAENHLVTCRGAGVDKTMLIVGKGSHSQRGGARIKPAIMQMMANTGGVVAAVHEKNEGCIVVEFARRR